MTHFPEKYPIKYRLLKDLPTLKAGAIFEKSDRGIWICKNDGMGLRRNSFSEKDLYHNPDWFEKIYEKFWMPAYNEEYAYLDFINVLLREDFYINERLNIDHDIDKFNFSIGNVFRTKLGAETCREYFVKPAFKKYHEMQKSEGAG